jgi:hypothetical protein
MPNSVVGSWQHLPLENVPAKVDQGGAVISDKIVFTGGCNVTTFSGDSCAVQDTYTITAGSSSGATELAAPLKCPAPRLSPTVIPNGNLFSTSFASQMIILLGMFNTTLWDDGGGLKEGEVVSISLSITHRIFMINSLRRFWTLTPKPGLAYCLLVIQVLLVPHPSRHRERVQWL